MKLRNYLILFFIILNACQNGNYYNHNQKRDRQFSHLEKDYKTSSSSKKLEFIKSSKASFNSGNHQNNMGNNYSDYDPNPDFSDEGQELDNKPQNTSNNTMKRDEINDEPTTNNNFEEVGLASWYGKGFRNQKTSNGEIYNPNNLTAAHPTLPLPSMVIVTNLDNGKSVKVRVNDRGPSSKNRIIDVSEKAAMELGFRDKGMARVKINLLTNTISEF